MLPKAVLLTGWFLAWFSDASVCCATLAGGTRETATVLQIGFRI